jgi:hypothetical protein
MISRSVPTSVTPRRTELSINVHAHTQPILGTQSWIMFAFARLLSPYAVRLRHVVLKRFGFFRVRIELVELEPYP